MSSLNSSPSNSNCLVCFSLFKSERCKNPNYFTTVFDVLCRLLGIDSIEPVRWNFDVHGIPFCEVCCPVVEKLKKLNHQFKFHKREINSILHIIKQNILKSGNFSNSSAKDVNLTLINRVHYFNSQVTGGFCQLYSNDAEYEHVKTSIIGQFSQVEIESNGDAIHLKYPDRIKDEECIVKVDIISEKDPLIEQTEKKGHFGIGTVIKEELSACVNQEASINEKESSFQGHVMGNLHSIFGGGNDVSTRVQTSVIESEPEIKTNKQEPLKKTVCNSNVPDSKKKQKCEYCGKILSNRGHLVRHMRIHTGEKPYKCDVCGKPFAYSWTLVEHLRIHTGDKPFKCEFCDKSFTMSYSFTKHRRLHSGGGNLFQCDFCDKSFVMSKDLKLHRRIHTGKLPNECEICHMSFPRPWDLKRHKQIHTGEKPYECEVCNKAFGRLGNLEQHQKIHTKTKAKIKNHRND